MNKKQISKFYSYFGNVLAGRLLRQMNFQKKTLSNIHTTAVNEC